MLRISHACHQIEYFAVLHTILNGNVRIPFRQHRVRHPQVSLANKRRCPSERFPNAYYSCLVAQRHFINAYRVKIQQTFLNFVYEVQTQPKYGSGNMNMYLITYSFHLWIYSCRVFFSLATLACVRFDFVVYKYAVEISTEKNSSRFG